MPRRFPPPWSIEESSACFIVRDHDKQALAMSILRLSPAGAQLLSYSPVTRCFLLR
jgi:hypothetical protein